MKITKGMIGGGLAVFVWCIFMGVTAISIGVGALYPPANLIAGPFVCPNGKLTFEQVVSNPLPGTTYTLTTWYCVNARSGAKTELEIFPMSLYAGIIYGLLLFVVVVLIWAWVQRNNFAWFSQAQAGARPDITANRIRSHNRAPQAPMADGGAVARMTELKKLRVANMITEAEYQEKRAEILRKL
ncbi:MAG: SHOCT domain-containing protein [Anaerolineales bacterium]